MRKRHIDTTGDNWPRFSAKMDVAAALAATFLFGALVFADVAEARPSIEGSNASLHQERGRMQDVWVDLTATGKRLEAKYAEKMKTLQAEIRESAPKITQEQHDVFLAHLSGIASADESLFRSKNQLRNFTDYEQAVANFHRAERNLESAKATVATRHAFMEWAHALPDDNEDKAFILEHGEGQLANRKRDLESAPKELEEARKSMESARQRRGELASEKQEKENAIAAVKAELAERRSAAMQDLSDAGIQRALSSPALDAKLVTFMVLREADPYWLAVYAQQGREYEQRIERLLNNTSLMMRMLVADGAVAGRYGKAMEIYENIQQVSPEADGGFPERLALAVALEHARPIAASTPEQEGFGNSPADNSIFIDPVERFLDYKRWWQDGELDPDFDKHDVWSLRMVVDSYQTGEYLTWGRQMLRNYRPDLVDYPVDSLRYSKVVDEEIQFSSMFLNWGNNLSYDRDDLERMQNILANGGICGRRAHFGHYILKAFGVPVERRSQRGHASIARYTPSGWVTYLGGPWNRNNRQVRGYRSCADFRASTEARQEADAFISVKRAQWIGKAMDENHRMGRGNGGWGYRDGRRWQNPNQAPPIEPWNAVASIKQEGIIQRVDPQILIAVAEDLGEADGSYDRHMPTQVQIPASERQITVKDAGVIHIPAAATASPTNNTENIRFMPSNLGGYQLHFRRYGMGERFAYTVEAPKAGTYELSARLVTPAWDQSLDLTINGANEVINIELPYTKGMWGELEPVRVELQDGTNVLTFSRLHFYFRGVSIRDFTLVPVN